MFREESGKELAIKSGKKLKTLVVLPGASVADNEVNICIGSLSEEEGRKG